MSSSGLIYAVIVGAWAAYLVPMWLRRQDELNEARPTERFTTAIRLLAGRSGLEKRARSRTGDAAGDESTRSRAEREAPSAEVPVSGVRRRQAERHSAEHGVDADARQEAVQDTAESAEGHPEAEGRSETEADPSPFGGAGRPEPTARREAPVSLGPVRGEDATDTARPAHAEQAPAVHASDTRSSGTEHSRAERSGTERPSSEHRPEGGRSGAGHVPSSSAVRSSVPVPPRRATVLARRRRVVSLLFLVFTLGACVAGVFGLGLLWVPLVPGALLSVYIVYLRRQEARRYRGRLRSRQRPQRERTTKHEKPPPPERGERTRPTRPQPHSSRSHGEPRAERRRADDGIHGAERAAPPRDAAPRESPQHESPAPRREASGSAVAGVEEQHDEESADGPAASSENEAEEGWDPVPLPLPTYVTAPVAPRNPGKLDLSAPDTLSAARAELSTPQTPLTGRESDSTGEGERAGRRGSSAGRPPSAYQNPFSGYDGEDRPRAANE